MMKKLMAMILALCLLTGCSLAVPGERDVQPQDAELTGFLLSVSMQDGETLTDLWDAEAAGMEPLHTFPMEGQSLWARRIEENGIVRYEFPEGLGLSCFCYNVFTEKPEDTYRSSTTSPEMADVTRRTESGSDGSTHYLEATIYASADSTACVYMNPVYQTPEGEVYALGTAPMGSDTASMYGYAETLTQETTLEMGINTTLASTVKMNIERVELPEVYIIIEMDGQNHPLRQSEYTPGALPEVYTPGTDAAYLILEARDGADTVRSIYSPGEETTAMDTYYPGAYGLCIKGYTTIDWEGV